MKSGVPWRRPSAWQRIRNDGAPLPSAAQSRVGSLQPARVRTTTRELLILIRESAYLHPGRGRGLRRAHQTR